MIRTGLRSLTLVSLPLLAVGCFEDVGGVDETTSGDGDGDATGDGDGDATGDGDGDATGDGDPSGDGDGDATGDGDASGDGDGDASGDGDGEPVDPGPQIVESIPANDDEAASLQPFFLLFFDRVVDDGDATGKILVSQAGNDPVPVTIQPCPNLDPTCLAGLFPMSLQGPNGGLPPGTEHEIIVTSGFEDTNGVATTVDQVVNYTTFDYEPNFFDDSIALPEEVGGLSYDPGSQALFVVGVKSNEFYGPRVRRIPLINGVPGAATTVWEEEPAGGGPWTYGLDEYGGQLFVAMSYAGKVQALGNLGANVTTGPAWSAPTLPAPNNNLDEVWSVARGKDGRTYFSRGNFFGGPDGIGILAVNTNSQWTVFNTGMNLWNDGEVMITVGEIDGTEYLIAGSAGVLYKFRTADGMLAATYELEFQDFSFDMEIDSQGRLWYGGYGVYVFDVSDNNELVTLARRDGIRCSRMAIREGINETNAYCVDFRDEAVISRVPVALP